MDDINLKIKQRRLFTGFDESTYYRQELYDFVVDNFTDPDVLFKVKIFGRYKQLYKWTDSQCQKFIDDNIEYARGYEVNGKYYLYDWGAGENRITYDKMHEPNLDHILPRERGGENTPENMRIRSRRLNENKGNTNSDQERYATIVDMLNDMDDVTVRSELIAKLYEQYCIKSNT